MLTLVIRLLGAKMFEYSKEQTLCIGQQHKIERTSKYKRLVSYIYNNLIKSKT